MEAVRAAVEYGGLDAQQGGLFPDHLANRGRLFTLGRFLGILRFRRGDARSRRERLARRVVNELRMNEPIAPIHRKPRPLRGTQNPSSCPSYAPLLDVVEFFALVHDFTQNLECRM